MVLMGLGSGRYLPFTKALTPTTGAAAYGEERARNGPWVRDRNCVGPRGDSRVNNFKVELASNIALDTACQLGKLTASFGVAQRDI